MSRNGASPFAGLWAEIVWCSTGGVGLIHDEPGQSLGKTKKMASAIATMGT